MTEALQTGASIAKKFISLHDRWPEKGKKILDPHIQECEKLLEATRISNAAMEDVNRRFSRLEACFPGSRRITTAETPQVIDDWCRTNGPPGNKAAEKDDAYVNAEGEIENAGVE